MKKRCEASPGPMDPAEEIARGLYSPDVFDSTTGRLTLAAVKIDDLISENGIVDNCGHSSGLSVMRINQPGGKDQIFGAIKTIIARPGNDGRLRKAIGYARAHVNAVESIEAGSLKVLDDGCNCLPCHAIIRTSDRTRSRASLRGARHELVQLLNNGIAKFGIA